MIYLIFSQVFILTNQRLDNISTKKKKRFKKKESKGKKKKKFKGMT